MSGQLEGKVALITGGTSGIGEATARLFAVEGAIVVLVGRNESKGLVIEKEITVKGGIAKFIKCDVAEEQQVENLINNVIMLFRHIDIVFNNAGIMLPSVEVERILLGDWKQTFAINLDGIFNVIKYAKEHLVASRGTIINNSSIAGLYCYSAGRSYAYSASKAAVIQFSRQMAKNYGEEGIRVNCICPGIIDTPILGDRDRQIYVERIPLKYIAKPIEVARVVVFLASTQAKYITGAVLPVDGGASL